MMEQASEIEDELLRLMIEGQLTRSKQFEVYKPSTLDRIYAAHRRARRAIEPCNEAHMAQR